MRTRHPCSLGRLTLFMCGDTVKTYDMKRILQSETKAPKSFTYYQTFLISSHTVRSLQLDNILAAVVVVNLLKS